MSVTRVIKVAILATADTRPKDISRALDEAFEDRDEVLQFTVEGHGVDGIEEATEETLMDAFVPDTAPETETFGREWALRAATRVPGSSENPC